MRILLALALAAVVALAWWFVLPMTLRFLTSMGDEAFDQMISATEYFGFDASRAGIGSQVHFGPGIVGNLHEHSNTFRGKCNIT